MTQIPARSASRLLDGVAFLNEHHGLAFNALLTLNFEQLGTSRRRAGKDALTAMNQFLARKIAGFAARHGGCGEHFYVYAHERCKAHGWHVHQLMATPPSLRRIVRPWLQEWAARNYENALPQAIDFRPAGGRRLDQIGAIQARMLRYILKTMASATSIDRDGQPADLYDLLQMKRLDASEHLSISRLAGTSQNLSLRAQIAAGFQPPVCWEDLLTDKQLDTHRHRKHLSELGQQLRNISI